MSYYFVAALCHAFTIEISKDMEMDNCTDFLDLIEVSETTTFKYLSRLVLKLIQLSGKDQNIIKKMAQLYCGNFAIFRSSSLRTKIISKVLK